MEPIAYSPAKPRTPLRRKPRPNNLALSAAALAALVGWMGGERVN